MTNEEHAKKIDELVAYSLSNETFAESLKAGAAALRRIDLAKDALEHAVRIFEHSGLSSAGIERIKRTLKWVEK